MRVADVARADECLSIQGIYFRDAVPKCLSDVFDQTRDAKRKQFSHQPDDVIKTLLEGKSS